MQGGSITEKKNTFQLNYLGEELQLSGNFDSGNLNNAYINNETNVKRISI
jgi:hypothetical protein